MLLPHLILLIISFKVVWISEIYLAEKTTCTRPNLAYTKTCTREREKDICTLHSIVVTEPMHQFAFGVLHKQMPH